MRQTALLPMLALACAQNQTNTAPASSLEPVTPAGAKAFIERVDRELKELWTDASYAEWVKNTYITDDTERLAAKANEKVLGYTAQAVKDAARYDALEVDPETRRKLHLLKLTTPIPAPGDAAKQKRLTTLTSKLEGMYGKGKYCKGEDCKDLGQLSKIIAESRDYDALLDAWQGWRTISKPMRPLYGELVDIINEGAREVGFANVGELWRAGYDMSPAEFEAETDRLWEQVKPLYEALHCHVRAKLSEKYGPEKVAPNGTIPAHILGNMWAQEWSNVYELVAPYAEGQNIDVSKALVEKGYDDQKMVKLAETFFTSLGMKKLPDSFWKNSQFLKPRDREVMCHASAWDVNFGGDIRIKMCIKVDEEDLITIHHELGHNYYFMYYNTLPFLYQNGAHDGFHEAIGDALALSVTPGYLKQAGIIDAVPNDEKALINLQMKDALDKIAFLPFGKLIDQWRWDVFSGKTKPAEYNAAWWKLRAKYQGVSAPTARTEEDFDPGAKYHIPSNVPYTRYFLARILQFQFHKAMCDAAGHQGPLHECSIHGNAEAGKRLMAMLSLGASKPWPDALESLTGTRQMDARPLLDYFAPLKTWLDTANAGRTCGW